MIRRKEKILIGALELLEAGGVNNVTTKNMAKQQGVSEPALYRQYKNKHEIIKGIIEEYAVFDEQIMNTISQSEMTGKEAIEFYVSRYAELYRNYSEITTVMFSMDVYFYDETTKARHKEIQDMRISFLTALVIKGVEDGSVAEKLSSEETALAIDGLIFSQIYQWRLDDKQYMVDERLLKMIRLMI